VVIYLDNQAAATALEIGSPIVLIQILVRLVFDAAMQANIYIIPRWLSRNDPRIAINDDQSKLTDTTDWMLDKSVFKEIEAFFKVKHTLDRFATHINTQCKHFNSNVNCPGVTGVNAWLQKDWGAPEIDNWLFPPFADVAATVRKLEKAAGRGTLLCPLNTGAFWWPYVAQHAPGVIGRWQVPHRKGLLLKFGLTRMTTAPRQHLIAVRMDFRKNRPIDGCH
jgi:hypothetical protein